MAAHGGKRPKAGRKKGVPNKVTKDLKAMILGALEAVEGQAYLEKLARDDPRTFCSLLGRIIPTTHAGDPDNPVRLAGQIELVIVDPKSEG
jgi:hypothetical protein